MAGQQDQMLDPELQAELVKYREVQAEIQQLVLRQTQLSGQQSENQIVKEELDKAEDETPIYKLIGPVLVRQDAEEARFTVNSRLQYLERELANVEDALKEKQAEGKAAEDRVVDKQRAVVAKAQAAQQGQEEEE